MLVLCFVGKTNLSLTLVPDSQTTSQLSPEDQVSSPATSLASGIRGVSPVQGPSRSPLSPPLPIKGFNWPDVRELRSRYSDHGRSQTVPESRHSSSEQNVDGGRRRHSSVSSSLHLGDAPSGGPSHTPRGSQDKHSKRLHRANSLDPRLSGEQMSELQRLQEQVAHGNYSSYYITAEAPRTDDPEHKIIIMEKLPGPEEPAIEPTKNDGGGGYVQIRSPTSREKISIMAVIDRCRVYQESDEYKHREEVKAKTEPARPQEPDKMTAASTEPEATQNTGMNSGLKVESGQKNMVKNLREKFQNRS